jgi:hypothetical protein
VYSFVRFTSKCVVLLVMLNIYAYIDIWLTSYLISEITLVMQIAELCMYYYIVDLLSYM